MSKEPITAFSRQHFFLSNFHPSSVTYKGVAYKSAEHAFQAQKAWTTQDHDYVKAAATPAEAKRRGKEITRVDTWDDIKVNIMRDILRAKFAPLYPNGQVNSKNLWLRMTEGRELIEGNNWGDTFWGQSPLGNGQNMLGKLLMEVRKELLRG